MWEDWWEQVFAIQSTLGVSDTMLAYMIKEASTKNSELGNTLEHLKHTDHSLLKAGFPGVKALIEEDYAPSGHLIKKHSRERIRNSYR